SCRLLCGRPACLGEWWLFSQRVVLVLVADCAGLWVWRLFGCCLRAASCRPTGGGGCSLLCGRPACLGEWWLFWQRVVLVLVAGCAGLWVWRLFGCCLRAASCRPTGGGGCRLLCGRPACLGEWWLFWQRVVLVLVAGCDGLW